MLAITDFMLPLIHRKMCNVPVNRNYGARSKQRLLFHHMATMMPREREREREGENGEENGSVVSFAIVLRRLSRMETRRYIDRKWDRSGMVVDGVRGCSLFFSLSLESSITCPSYWNYT